MNHTMLAFINSPAQLMVIAVLVLILFGAKKLPLFARSLGRSMGEFKRARDEFERELFSAHDDSYNRRPEAPKSLPVTEEPKPQQPEPAAAATTSAAPAPSQQA